MPLSREPNPGRAGRLRVRTARSLAAVLLSGLRRDPCPAPSGRGADHRHYRAMGLFFGDHFFLFSDLFH